MTRRKGVIQSGDGISNTPPLTTPKKLRTCCSIARVNFLSPFKVGACSTLFFDSKISISCLRWLTHPISSGTRVRLTPSGVVCTPRYLGVRLPLTKRSEEHTSELQSRQYLVCRLLLEKK